MGFTNVAWESRGTEQLARDLTEGPGPTPVGQAGASWLRVANELAAVTEEFRKVAEQVTASAEGGSADAIARKLDDFASWLQEASIGAATNGEKAEQAAIAQSVAILAMPTVSEAVQAQTQRDVMASLGAYNAAVLNGHFAAFDELANIHHTSASAVMYQYEEACEGMAQPWDQPRRHPDSNAKHDAKPERDGSPAAVGGASEGAAIPPPPLGAFQVGAVNSTKKAAEVRATGSVGGAAGGGSGWAGMGGGYGAMGAGLARTDHGRAYESSLATDALAGAGEASAGISTAGGSWLPAAQQSDVPVLVSNVSWGPNSSVFDQLVSPEEPQPSTYSETPERTLEQVSDRWVSPAVIGDDRKFAL